MKDKWRMMKDDDFKLLRGFADKLTDEQTFVIVESLSRLKNRAEVLGRMFIIHLLFCTKTVIFQSRKRLYIHKCPSVRLSVRQSVSHRNPSTAWNHHPSSFILHPSTFIILHLSFLHFATFKLFSLLNLILSIWPLWRSSSFKGIDSHFAPGLWQTAKHNDLTMSILFLQLLLCKKVIDHQIPGLNQLPS